MAALERSPEWRVRTSTSSSSATVRPAWPSVRRAGAPVWRPSSVGSARPWTATYGTWRDDVADVPDRCFAVVAPRVVVHGHRRHVVERPYGVFDNGSPARPPGRRPRRPRRRRAVGPSLRVGQPAAHRQWRVRRPARRRGDGVPADARPGSTARGPPDGVRRRRRRAAAGVCGRRRRADGPAAVAGHGDADVLLRRARRRRVARRGDRVGGAPSRWHPTVCASCSASVSAPTWWRRRRDGRSSASRWVAGCPTAASPWWRSARRRSSPTRRPATRWRRRCGRRRGSRRRSPTAATHVACGRRCGRRRLRRTRRLHDYGLEVLLGLGPAELASFFDAFFDLPVDVWAPYLRVDSPPQAVVRAMSAVLRALPWSMRRRLVANPFGGR